jgi:hypothetical protein
MVQSRTTYTRLLKGKGLESSFESIGKNHSLQCLLNLLRRITPLLRLATSAFFGTHLAEESGQS